MSFANQLIKPINRIRGERLNRSENFRLDLAERINNFHKNIFKKILKNINQEDIITYPSQKDYTNFKFQAAKFYRTIPSNVYFDAGSDACLKNFIHTFLAKGDNLIIPFPSFPMYEIYAKTFGVKTKRIINESSFFTSIKEIKKKIDKKTRAVIIANPGAPYGEIYKKDSLIELIKFTNKKKIPFLIDEAYIEFSNKGSMIRYINSFDNLFILRTLSKNFGLAGLRIGFIFSNYKNIEDLERVQLTYPVSNLSLKIADFFFKEQKYHKCLHKKHQ